MNRPKSLSKETILNGFLTIQKERLQFANGYEHDHFIMSLPTPTSVSVVALDEAGSLIINEEYRHSAGDVVLSLPGGFLSEEEDPLLGGQRELLEETGYHSDHLTMLGSSFPMPGICDQKVIYVMAENSRKISDPDLEGSEIIHTALMPEEDLRESVSSGTAVDGILLAGLWFFSQRDRQP